MIALITGPVRSGKSTYALQVAQATGKTIVYLATAAVDQSDAEMMARIERHRAERGDMRTIETGADPAGLITAIANASAEYVLVIDSLGTWVTAHLLAREDLAERDAVAAERAVEADCEPLFGALSAADADVIVVSEETGWGVVPMTPLGRIFRDVLGRLTARLARRADRAELVVAGFAVDLRAAGRPVG